MTVLETKLTTEQLERVDLYTWMKNQAVLPSKERYSFAGHHYLEEIAKHQWKPGDHLFIRKSSQCGASEYALDIIWWMHERKLPGFQGSAYFFPAKSQLDDHVKSRVMPVLETPRFANHVDLLNLSYARYGGKPVYFRSGQTRRNMISFSACFIVLDEFDEYINPMAVIPTMEARFNHSPYKWILGLSTCTYPDVGIDAAYKNSNQHHYHIPCSVCNRFFSPLAEVEVRSFENCVIKDGSDVGFLCPHCNELVNTCGVEGKWVLEHPADNQNYGYSISRLFTPRTTLAELKRLHDDALNMQEFYNSNLGLPYSPANSRLSHGNVVERCIGIPEKLPHCGEPTWCGIDVGKKCNYIIGRGDKDNIEVIAYGIVPFDGIDKLLYKYNVKTLVIDLRPYEQEVKKIIKGKNGFYASDYNVGNQESWYTLGKIDQDVGYGKSKVIKNHKIQTCDVVIESVAAKKSITFPASTKSDQEFIKQLCCLQRMEDVDPKTGELKVYYSNTGKRDHYFHALGYLILAFQMKKSGNVATPGAKIW